MDLVIWWLNPKSSKCLVHDTVTRMFLRKDGTWTEDPEEAFMFNYGQDAKYAIKEKKAEYSKLMSAFN